MLGLCVLRGGNLLHTAVGSVPKRQRDLFDIFPDLPWPRIGHHKDRAVIEQQVGDAAVKWAVALARAKAAMRLRNLLVNARSATR